MGGRPAAPSLQPPLQGTSKGSGHSFSSPATGFMPVSSSRAVTGWLKKYPCPKLQPWAMRNRSWASCSIPSATTFSPRLLAIARMVWTRLVSPPSVSMSLTKLRSIFSRSRGYRLM